MRGSILLVLVACSGDPKGGGGGGDTALLGDTEPQFEGPFEYGSADDGGVWLIDTLWIVSEQAVEEIAALGDTPESYLDWRIDDMNDTLERSLIDSSRVRSLGVHVLVDDDYARSGVEIGDTSVNISNALTWLGSYREVYGADKVMIVAGTEEGASGAALGGGDVSAHWVTFLPVEHEFGHQMGGSHCNKGAAGSLNYGYPASGYTDDGFAVEGGPVSAGTRMCGNSIALFSNPDVRLTLDEVEELVADGLAPAGDWAALVEDDGRIPMGDADYADMASQWRSVEQSAAERLPTRRYDGEAGAPYPEDGCVALFAEEGYGALREVLCAGEQATDLGAVASVQVGAGAHVNLYSDAGFGAGSMCGGQVLRLGYSTPSLDALSDHLGTPTLSGGVGAALAYAPEDRDAHRYAQGPYEFYGSGASPTCPQDALLLMPDNRAWSATAAVYQQPVSVPFAADFTVTSSHDDGGKTPPADAMAFFFAKAADAYEVAPVSREQQGVAADGTGYAVELNVWTGSVSIRDGDWEPLAELRYDTFTDGAPVPVRVEVRADEIVLYWDGAELLRADVDLDATHETVGFSAATGAYTIEYLLEGVTYTAL